MFILPNIYFAELYSNALSKAKLTLFGGWDTCVPTLGTHVSQPPIIIISGMCPNPADDQLPMA